MHSAVGVCAHSYGLYQASVHTAAKPLSIPTTQDSDLQTQSEHFIQKPISLEITSKNLTDTLRSSLYLYIPMVHGPWVG